MANAQEEEQQLPSNQTTSIRMEHFLKASSDTCGTIRSSTTARTTAANSNDTKIQTGVLGESVTPLAGS
jgi:hypothetical protein